MKAYIPQLGDIVAVNRGGYVHLCVYLGTRFLDNRDVIHNEKGGVVCLTTMSDFSGGASVYLHKAAPSDPFERQAILKRAFSLIGTKYDLFKFNCEHAANWIQSGRSESPQLQGALWVVALIGLVFASRRA